MKKTFSFIPEHPFAHDFNQAAHCVAYCLVGEAIRIIRERGKEYLLSLLDSGDITTERLAMVLTSCDSQPLITEWVETIFLEDDAIEISFSKEHGGGKLLLEDGAVTVAPVTVTSLEAERLVTCVLTALDGCCEGEYTVTDDEKLTRRAGYFLTQPVSYY